MAAFLSVSNVSQDSDDSTIVWYPEPFHYFESGARVDRPGEIFYNWASLAITDVPLAVPG
jgi:hypothetical protein